MKNFIIIILGFVVFASCGKSNKDKSFSLLQKWIGKELSLPARSVFYDSRKRYGRISHSKHI